MSASSSSSPTTAHRARTTSAAVWRQRRKGETMTLWMGKPTDRSFFPIVDARVFPMVTNGGSQGRVALDIHRGCSLSIRSPWRITNTFWRIAFVPVDRSINPIGWRRKKGRQWAWDELWYGTVRRVCAVRNWIYRRRFWFDFFFLLKIWNRIYLDYCGIDNNILTVFNTDKTLIITGTESRNDFEGSLEATVEWRDDDSVDRESDRAKSFSCRPGTILPKLDQRWIPWPICSFSPKWLIMVYPVAVPHYNHVLLEHCIILHYARTEWKTEWTADQGWILFNNWNV